MTATISFLAIVAGLLLVVIGADGLARVLFA